MTKNSNLCKMFSKSIALIFSIFLLNLHSICVLALHEGFTYVTDVVEDVILEPRYFSTYNFVGKRIDGYNEPKIIISKEAANALKIANEEIKMIGYCFKIWDAYRPQRAVQHFIRWAKDTTDNKMKKYFYPDVDKSKLFELGYIAVRSGHSRGSTVDLTIVDMKTGKEVDMGAQFDFFHEISNHGTSLITEKQAANRNILKIAMENAGFKSYSKEWWHYTLKDEPFPDTYFDFLVE
ncbi:MAG: M15 family metallopeptidase [Firmicutes bacterium]|nr:M15 family metallopeptidase [Bacillota bacterium]